MHADHAVDPRDLVQKEILILLHVRHDDLQLIVGLLARDQVALLHLGVAAHDALELLEALGCVPVHSDVQQHGQLEPERTRRQPHDALADHAGFLELLDPPRARRRRQADPIGDLLIAESAVLLQQVEDLQVVSVKPNVFRHVIAPFVLCALECCPILYILASFISLFRYLCKFLSAPRSGCRSRRPAFAWPKTMLLRLFKKDWHEIAERRTRVSKKARKTRRDEHTMSSVGKSRPRTSRHC